MKDSHWFNEARYGMFIHWGIYSAAGRGEWMPNRERMSKEEYVELYAHSFRAENYDPAKWAELAVASGMKYAVLTTRHHDGFALWPTKTSDFHAGNIGPKRDLLGPFVEAFRAAGLKVGFYYSPADWFHPDYPGPHFRDWPGVNDWKSEEHRLRFIEYYRSQLREILTNYGKIDYLWYDGCIPSDLQSVEANEEAMRLQPGILINERNGSPWQVKITEGAIRAPKEGVLWEACLTLNDNWGYHAGDHNWKDARRVLQMLTETAAGAGNLLLNVGPRADGSIPEQSEQILREAGRWLAANEASIRNSSRSPFTWSNWGRVTVNGKRVYLHIWNSTGSELRFAELKNRVLGAKFLESGAAIDFVQGDDLVVILKGLPDPLPDALVTTIELEVEGTPEVHTAQTSFWIPGE